MTMVHWAWIPFSLFIGAMIGIFWFSWLEISREDKNKKE